METSEITQVIEREMRKENVLIDDVLITELEKLRVGPNAFFEVRKLHGGLYRHLGIWKININTAEILGVALNSSSLDKLMPIENYRSILKNLQIEEKMIRENSSTPKKILERFSAERVDSLFKLINPKNYLRIHINSIVQKAIKPRNRLEFTPEALHLYNNEGTEISERLALGASNEISKMILDLSEYSAISNNRDKITNEDIINASNFIKTILSLALDLFSDQKDDYFKISEQDMNKLVLYNAFTAWRPFRRLPPKFKTPKTLVLLIIDDACLHYAMDNFPEDITAYKKYSGD